LLLNASCPYACKDSQMCIPPDPKRTVGYVIYWVSQVHSTVAYQIISITACGILPRNKRLWRKEILRQKGWGGGLWLYIFLEMHLSPSFP